MHEAGRKLGDYLASAASGDRLEPDEESETKMRTKKHNSNLEVATELCRAVVLEALLVKRHKKGSDGASGDAFGTTY